MRISNTYLLNINIQYLTIILLRKIKSCFPILCEKIFLLQEVVLVVVGAGRWGAGTPLLPPLSTALNSKSIFIIWEHVTNFKTFTHFRPDWCHIINVHKVMVPKVKTANISLPVYNLLPFHLWNSLPCIWKTFSWKHFMWFQRKVGNKFNNLQPVIVYNFMEIKTTFAAPSLNHVTSYW